MEQTETVEVVESPVASPIASKVRDKRCGDLFTVAELGYYGSAIVVYVILGVFLTDKVLNFVVGPLFFIGWIWVVPPVWQRLSQKFRSRR